MEGQIEQSTMVRVPLLKAQVITGNLTKVNKALNQDLENHTVNYGELGRMAWKENTDIGSSEGTYRSQSKEP